MAPSDPLQELTYIQRRMSRLLEEGLARPRRLFGRMDRVHPALWEPRINVYARDDAVVIFVELPGMGSRNEVNVEVKGKLLVITGVRHPPEAGEEASPLVTEGHFGPFSRTLELSENVDPAGVTAKLKHGLLEIHAPRRKPKETFRIKIVEFE